jgi:hypothetical protein
MALLLVDVLEVGKSGDIDCPWMLKVVKIQGNLVFQLHCASAEKSCAGGEHSHGGEDLRAAFQWAFHAIATNAEVLCMA